MLQASQNAETPAVPGTSNWISTEMAEFSSLICNQTETFAASVIENLEWLDDQMNEIANFEGNEESEKIALLLRSPTKSPSRSPRKAPTVPSPEQRNPVYPELFNQKKLHKKSSFHINPLYMGSPVKSNENLGLQAPLQTTQQSSRKSHQFPSLPSRTPLLVSNSPTRTKTILMSRQERSLSPARSISPSRSASPTRKLARTMSKGVSKAISKSTKTTNVKPSGSSASSALTLSAATTLTPSISNEINQPTSPGIGHYLSSALSRAKSIFKGREDDKPQDAKSLTKSLEDKRSLSPFRKRTESTEDKVTSPDKISNQSPKRLPKVREINKPNYRQIRSPERSKAVPVEKDDVASSEKPEQKRPTASLSPKKVSPIAKPQKTLDVTKLRSEINHPRENKESTLSEAKTRPRTLQKPVYKSPKKHVSPEKSTDIEKEVVSEKLEKVNLKIGVGISKPSIGISPVSVIHPKIEKMHKLSLASQQKSQIPTKLPSANSPLRNVAKRRLSDDTSPRKRKSGDLPNTLSIKKKSDITRLLLKKTDGQRTPAPKSIPNTFHDPLGISTPKFGGSQLMKSALLRSAATADRPKMMSTPGGSPYTPQLQLRKFTINKSPKTVLPDIHSDSLDDEDPSVLQSWANSPELKATLKNQQKLDPDKVFGPVGTLNMTEVFRGSADYRAKSFGMRSSSARWDHSDLLTASEIENYKKEMGYQ